MGQKRAANEKAIPPIPRGQVRRDSGQFGTTHQKLMQYQPPDPGMYFPPSSKYKYPSQKLLGGPTGPPSLYLPHIQSSPRFPVVPLQAYPPLPVPTFMQHPITSTTTWTGQMSPQGSLPPPPQLDLNPSKFGVPFPTVDWMEKVAQDQKQGIQPLGTGTPMGFGNFSSPIPSSRPQSIYDSPGTGTSIGTIGGAFPSPINPKQLAPAIVNPMLGSDGGGIGGGGGGGGGGGKSPKIPGALGGLFQTLKTMGPQGAAFAAANMAFESFMKLIDKINPFKSVFEALGEIFEVYGAILEVSMMPLIEALFEQMLAPEVLASVEKLGLALGEFAAELIPFIPTFIQMGAILIDIAIAILPLVVDFLPGIKLGLDLLAIALNMALVPITIVTSIFDKIYDSGIGLVMQDVSDIINNIALLTFTGINDALEEFKGWLVDIETFFDNLQVPAFMSGSSGGGNGETDNAIAIALLGPLGGAIYGAIEDAVEKRSPSEAQIVINVYGDLTEEVALDVQKEMWLRNLK